MNVIFNNVLSIKLVLMFVSFIILVLLIIFVPKFNKDYLVYLVSFLSVVGSVLFPLWFFQGIQKMKYITIMNMIAKVFSTLLIFVFVKNNNDIILAVFFQTLNLLIPGITALIFVNLKFNMKFRFNLKKESWITELVGGFHVFMTSIWVNVYVQGAVVITGFIASNKAAGYYAIGQKIMAAMVGIMQPIGQAAYPYMCDLYAGNFRKFLDFKTKLIKFCIVMSLASSGILFVFSEFFIYVVAGEPNKYLNLLIKLFAISVFFIVINTQITQVMYVINKDKVLQKLYLLTAVIFIVISIPLTLFYSALGMIISVIVIEFIVFITTITLVKNKKINERAQEV
ncbi:oligosaccharide flippase family protein [Bacillus megaterium]|nr:oligosaccharide flippase family protein [Priestia megaterium]